MDFFSIDSGSGFENLRASSFKNAQKLKYIEIYQNNIEEIGSRIFVEAPNLESIHFYGNKIRMIHYSAFEGLSKLKYISLYRNQILFIYPQTFSELLSLQYLFLGNNKCLNKAFEEFGNFTEIENEIEENCKFWPISNEPSIQIDSNRNQSTPIQIDETDDTSNSSTTIIKTTKTQNSSFLSEYFVIYLIICKACPIIVLMIFAVKIHLIQL